MCFASAAGAALTMQLEDGIRISLTSNVVCIASGPSCSGTGAVTQIRFRFQIQLQLSRFIANNAKETNCRERSLQVRGVALCRFANFELFTYLLASGRIGDDGEGEGGCIKRIRHR